jgi:hypothetical protein
LFFETGFYCGAQAGLQIAMNLDLRSKFKILEFKILCLSLLSAGIAGMYHHALLFMMFFSLFFFLPFFLPSFLFSVRKFRLYFFFGEAGALLLETYLQLVIFFFF